ncbi:uracil transport protein [Loigolactobacillus rennini DSM 20253]|uniref:Uracil transport protein n=1 Tax=Loigolactobacillus rennini DSM 20253 TaxID=1423796 RepID=A0A0R2D6B2_9LACO|nr:uracil transport protein [Loigolactobacillus rennini DSM 20253]
MTQGKIPAYLGSSFAFVVAMQALMKTQGYPAIAQGSVAVGIIYLLVALLISRIDSGWIDKILPPVVVGPVVMVIGLSLAGTAAKDAMMNQNHYDLKFFLVALITLGLTIAFNMLLKGFLSLIPILLGIVGGYLVATLFGLIDFTPVTQAAWLAVPDFELPFISYHPKLYWSAILGMAPIAFVTMTEHMGHIMVLDELTQRDFFKDPGLHRTLSGDGLASIIAGFIGGPPVTSYGENIGVLAITKVHSVFVIIGAGVLAVIFGFVGKLSALIMSIPSPVIGGISFLLFGVIAANGLRILIENKIDFDKKRNLMIAATILVVGIGGAYLQLGDFQLTGVALATLLGIFLNLVLPKQALNELE